MILDWPIRKGNKPVTTGLNHAILRAAVNPARAELPDAVRQFEQALEGCGSSNWRRDYKSIMEQFVRIQASASTKTVVEMCQAGLDCASSSFVMRSQPTSEDDNSNQPLTTIADYFAACTQTENKLTTLSFTGKAVAASTKFQLASPHGTDTDPLWVSGDDAVAQIKAWYEYGCMEPSAMEHATATCLSNNVSEYVQDKVFCLLGVTSEMGPAKHLLQIPGARVMGIARSGPKLDHLVDWFHNNGAHDTILNVACANLLEQMPQIAQWIIETATALMCRSNMSSHRPQQTLVLVPLAYMDGEANVRVTVAMDSIVQYVIKAFAPTGTKVALVYFTSPTTIYTIPPEAAQEAERRYNAEQQQKPWSSWMSIVSTISLGNWLQPSNTWLQLTNNSNEEKPPVVVYNGVYTLQGPNYCLAKLMQQWRCIVSQYSMVDDGSNNNIQVCAPHAPGTRTLSVMHNANAAVAVEGLQYIPPLLTFDVVPCSSLMTAIVIHQLSSLDRQPATTTKNVRHPLDMFWDGSVHGGGWRCPYNSESILALTYILGKTIAKPGWCPPSSLAPKPLSSSNEP